MSISSEPPLVPSATRLSVLQRAGRVFARPAEAWEGFDSATHPWFPLLLVAAVEVAVMAVTFERALLPDLLARWYDMVASGRMEPSQVAMLQEGMSSNPLWRWSTIGAPLYGLPLVTLFVAAVLWAVVGFLLGGRLRFGRAWALTAWAGLVMIPASVLRAAIAVYVESYRAVHLGLGVLVPEPETPSRLLAALTAFLEALSPFSAWWLVVLILGAARISGLPRGRVAVALTVTYLILALGGALFAALFAPGA